MEKTDQLLLPPKRRASRIVRWYLKYNIEHDWFDFGIALIWMLFIVYWANISFTDRHRAAWSPAEKTGIVESYDYNRPGKNFSFRQYYTVHFTIPGEEKHGSFQSYNYDVPWIHIKHDETYKKGDELALERYRGSIPKYRVLGLRYARKTPMLLCICFGFYMLMQLLSLLKRKERRLLLEGDASFANFQEEGKTLGILKYKSFVFQVNGRTYSVVSTASDEKLQGQPLVFYDPKRPEKAMMLADVDENIELRNGKIVLSKFDFGVLGAVSIALCGYFLLFSLILIAIAPMLPI